MTLPSPDTPPADVPEADWAEQAVDADPLADAEAEDRTRPTREHRPWLREVDDADLVEQETPAYVEDDDVRG